MLRTHMIRAETSQAMSKDQYRHEANAFWELKAVVKAWSETCLLYTSPSPRDKRQSRMPSSA